MEQGMRWNRDNGSDGHYINAESKGRCVLRLNDKGAPKCVVSFIERGLGPSHIDFIVEHARREEFLNATSGPSAWAEMFTVEVSERKFRVRIVDKNLGSEEGLTIESFTAQIIR